MISEVEWLEQQSLITQEQVDFSDEVDKLLKLDSEYMRAIKDYHHSDRREKYQYDPDNSLVNIRKFLARILAVKLRLIDTFFTVKQKRAMLLEAEIKSPGFELAYILKARKEFDRNHS